jgi:hypothetical protein
MLKTTSTSTYTYSYAYSQNLLRSITPTSATQTTPLLATLIKYHTFQNAYTQNHFLTTTANTTTFLRKQNIVVSPFLTSKVKSFSTEPVKKTSSTQNTSKSDINNSTSTKIETANGTTTAVATPSNNSPFMEKAKALKNQGVREIKWLIGGFRQLFQDTYNLIKLNSRARSNVNAGLPEYQTASEQRFVARTIANLKISGPLAVIYVIPVVGNFIFYLLLFKPLAIPSVLLSPSRRYQCIEIRDKEYRKDFLEVLAHSDSTLDTLPRTTLLNSLTYLNDLASTNLIRNSAQLAQRFEQWRDNIVAEDAGFRAEGFANVSTTELIDACDKRGLINALLTDDMSKYSTLLTEKSSLPDVVQEREALNGAIRERLMKTLESWLQEASKLTDTSVKSYLSLSDKLNKSVS